MSEAMNDAIIVINGSTLTPGQNMTLRVALGNLLMDMQPERALGDDEHGIFMRRSYIENIVAIYRMMEDI